MKLANTCPLAFRYKYIEHIREDVATIEARVGKAVHALLELVTGGASLDGALTLVVPRLRLKADEQTALRPFYDGVTAFAKRMAEFRARTRVVRELREERLGLTADGQPAVFHDRDVFFRGVWDLGFVLADDRVVIVDHKTGKATDPRFHAEQLRAYAVQAHARFPGLSQVRIGLHFPRVGKVAWLPAIPAREIAADLVPWFMEWINRAAERVDTDQHRPIVSSFCKQCGYRPRCPAHYPQLDLAERPNLPDGCGPSGGS